MVRQHSPGCSLELSGSPLANCTSRSANRDTGRITLFDPIFTTARRSRPSGLHIVRTICPLSHPLRFVGSAIITRSPGFKDLLSSNHFGCRRITGRYSVNQRRQKISKCTWMFSHDLLRTWRRIVSLGCLASSSLTSSFLRFAPFELSRRKWFGVIASIGEKLPLSSLN